MSGGKGEEEDEVEVREGDESSVVEDEGGKGGERGKVLSSKAALSRRPQVVARVLVDAVAFFAALDRKSGLMGRTAAPSSEPFGNGYR